MAKRWVVTARDIFVGTDIIRAFNKIHVEEDRAAYLVAEGFAVYDDLEGGGIGKDAVKALYSLAVQAGFSGRFEDFQGVLKGGAAGGEAYRDFQEGYYSVEDLQRFNADSPLINGKFITIPWPKSFSTRPMVHITADVVSKSARVVYIQNITETGFDLACNYAADLKGVWYRAYVK